LRAFSTACEELRIKNEELRVERGRDGKGCTGQFGEKD
jgi:hypothetical protein